MEKIFEIAEFIFDSFLHIWPYLVITIPLSVVLKLTDGAKYINKAFRRRPVTAIVIATLVGAISPFCSCGVIPVIASLLIGGVPIGPVMSFWIASPSMDPEIFFLSVSTLGWNLAIWRFGSTLILSLAAGFITHYLDHKNLLGYDIVRKAAIVTPAFSFKSFIQNGINSTRNIYTKKQTPATELLLVKKVNSHDSSETVCCTTSESPVALQYNTSDTAPQCGTTCSDTCSQSMPTLYYVFSCIYLKNTIFVMI
jgi:uncharacterized membrane protein YraQ (UPF0718 family)